MRSDFSLNNNEKGLELDVLIFFFKQCWIDLTIIFINVYQPQEPVVVILRPLHQVLVRRSPPSQ